MNDDRHLDFVLRHYREDALDTQKALRSVHSRAGQQRPSGHRWIAVAASLLCLAVLAAVITLYRSSPQTPTATESQASAAVTAAAADSMQQQPVTFHFDNVPLPAVLRQLGDYYGVSLRADQTDKRLTGDFEADSLSTIIRLIEEVLEVEISQSQE